MSLNKAPGRAVRAAVRLAMAACLEAGLAPRAFAAPLGFGAKSDYSTSANPAAVVVADFNLDGKLDQAVSQGGAGTGNAAVLLGNGAGGFAAKVDISAPGTVADPRDMAVGDFNLDGEPDIAVAAFGADQINVFNNATTPGSPTPSFNLTAVGSGGTQPRSVAVADFNGDGKPDVAAANFGGNNASVLLNTTSPGSVTPTFATPQAFAAGSGPVSIAAGDFNGDGRPDLAVVNINASTVSVLLNTTPAGNGTPTFASQQAFATGPFPASVAVGDFNGDGKPDLAVANNIASAKTVSVLLNTTTAGSGTPVFSAKTDFATGTNTRGLAVADFDMDGRPDLAATNEADNTVSVLLNNAAPAAGAPSFQPQQTFATGANPLGIAAGDFNGDGKPDLINANYSGASVSARLNTTTAGLGSPSFAAKTDYTTAADPRAAAIADFNGDGRLDQASSNGSGNSVSVFINQGSGAFGAKTDFPGPGSAIPQGIAVGDFNLDGKPDIAAADNGTANVLVFDNLTTPGSPTPSFGGPTAFSGVGSPESVAVADFNVDGKPDMAAANFAGNNVSVFLNNITPGAATPSFAGQSPFATGNSPASVAAADFNLDGKPDLVAANSGSGNVSVLLNTTPAGNGAPSFSAQQAFGAGTTPKSVAVGDFNGDGKPDIAVANNGDNNVSVLLNTTPVGNGTPTFASQQTFATGTDPRAVVVGDFDLDGRPDLATVNAGPGTVSVLRNTTTLGAGTPSFGPNQNFGTGAFPIGLASGDLNNDGIADLAAANNDVGANSVSVLLNNNAAASTVKIWKGVNPGAASLGSNWFDGTAPANGDYVVFGATNPFIDCDWDLAVALSSITFTGDASGGYSGFVDFSSAVTVNGPFEILSPAQVYFTDNSNNVHALKGPVMINAAGSLLHIGGTTVVAEGNISIVAGATLEMHDKALFKGVSVNAAAGSVFKLYDDSNGATGPPTLTSTSPANALSLTINGTVDISSAIFGRLSPSGLSIPSANLSSIVSLSSMTFQGPLLPGTTAINLGLFDFNFVSTFTNVNFADPNIAVNVNASQVVGANSRITMRKASGLKAGPAYENDPNGIVDWPDIPVGPNFNFNGNLFGGLQIASDNDQNELGEHVLLDTFSPGGPYLYVLFRTTTTTDLGEPPDTAAIVKYDSNGVKLASATLQGNSSGNAFALENFTGNLFVGERNESGGITQAVRIARYNSNLQRFSELNIDVSEVSEIIGLATDGVSLYAHADANGGAKTIKYSIALVAQATATAPANYFQASGMTLDGSGNVYVVASTGDFATDQLLRKYDPTLTNPPVSVQLGSLSGNETDLALSGSSLYLTVLKPDGTQVYVRKFNAADLSYAGVSSTFTDVSAADLDLVKIRPGPDGSLYVVTTTLGPGSQKDYLVLRYDQNLMFVSSATFDLGNDSSGDDIGVGLAVEVSSKVYVTGTSNTGLSFDAVTARLNLGGALPAPSADTAAPIFIDYKFSNQAGTYQSPGSTTNIASPNITGQFQDAGSGLRIGQQPLATSSSTIAHWHFDEGIGSAAGDSSPNNNAGTLTGGATWAPVGKFGTAVSLNGSNGYVSVPNNSLWNFGSDPFTIEVWVNFNNVVPGVPVAFVGHDEGGGATNKWIFFMDSDGQLKFHFYAPPISYYPVVFPWTPAVGQWYQIAVTRNGSSYALYINGLPAANGTEPANIPTAVAPLTIGAAENNFFVNGIMDEVRISSRGLSADEVAAGYFSGWLRRSTTGPLGPYSFVPTGSVVVSGTPGTTAAVTSTASAVALLDGNQNFVQFLAQDMSGNTLVTSPLQVPVQVGGGGGGATVFARSLPLAPPNLGQNVMADQTMLSLRLWSEGGPVPLNSITLSLLGDAPAPQIQAKVYLDTNQNSVLDGDAFLGSIAFVSGAPPKANVVLNPPQNLTGTTNYYLVAVTYNNVPAGKKLEVSLETPADLGVAGAAVSGSSFPHRSGQSTVQLELFANPNFQNPPYPTPSSAPVSGGFDTALFINSGQKLSVQASGTWFNGAATVDADGNPGAAGCAGCLVPAAKRGALVGRIGGGSWFFMGATSTTTAAQGGSVYLAMNDGNYADNGGSINVLYQVLSSTAAKVWIGGNAAFPTKASIGSNWAGGQVPFNGERVVFGTSTFNCDWDINNLALASLTMTTSYAQVLRLIEPSPGIFNLLTVSTDVTVSGGTIDLGNGNTLSVQGELVVSSATLDMGSGQGRLQSKGLTLKGGAFLRSQGANPVTMEGVPNGPTWPFLIKNATVTVNNPTSLQVFNSSVIDISSAVAINAFDRVSLFGFSTNPSPSVRLHAQTPISRTFNNWIFDLSVSTNVDASDVASGSNIIFKNATGTRFGSPYELDPNDAVFWSPDGGGFGSICGVLSYTPVSGVPPGDYKILASTDPAGSLGGIAFTTLVSSGAANYGLGPGCLSVQAPNTWYLFGFKSVGNQPFGQAPRGGVGNPGSLRSNPLSVGANQTLTGQNITIQDWGTVSGNISFNTGQVGSARIQAWLGNPPCSTCTLEASAIGPPQPGGPYNLDTKPDSGYFIIGFVDVNNNNARDSFEASGTQSGVAVNPLSFTNNVNITVSGGSSAQGGTVYLTTAAAHGGIIGTQGAQAMMRLKLFASGQNATLNAIQAEYTGVFPPSGVSLQAYEDSNQNGVFDQGTGAGPGDSFRGSAFLNPGVSSGTVQFFTPDTIVAESTRTYFITVDLLNTKVPFAGVRISSSSNFGLAAGSMASQPGLYPVSSTATVKFNVPANFAAFPEGTGGAYTNFNVYSGQTLAIAATGTWVTAGAAAPVGPDGSGFTGLNTVLPSARVGELIGRIQLFNGSSSPWFRVGSSVTATLPFDGQLILAMNDFVGGYYDGNSGSVLADFSISGSTLGALAGTAYYTGGLAGPLIVTAFNFQELPAGTSTLALEASTTYYPYVIAGLAPGAYHVKAQVQNNADHKGDSVQKVEVVAGSTSTLDVTVFLGANSISGSLFYSGVQNYGNFVIVAATHTDFEHQVVFFGSATSPGGTYALADLPAPNTYYVAAFRDGNFNGKPDGTEPLGVFGVSTGAVSQFSQSLAPIFISQNPPPAAGKDITLLDKGAISGSIAVSTNAAGGGIVVVAGRGVPGSPGFFAENREFVRIPNPPPPPPGLYYQVGLLRPATDYSLFAFLDSNGNGQFNGGEAFFQSAGLSVPSGGFANVNFSLLAAPPPPSVSGFAGTGAPLAVNFVWNLVQGATQYQLRTSTGGIRAVVLNPASNYTDVLAANTSSQITQITAANPNGVSPLAGVAPVFSLAAVPTGLAVTSATFNTAALSWTPQNPAGTQFELHRATGDAAPGPFSVIFVGTATTRIDAGLSPNTTYFWQVLAINGNGIKSTFSAQVSTQTPVSNAPSIAGLVSYAGLQAGSVVVQAYKNSGFVGIASATVILPNLPSQPYYLPVAAGTYFVRGFVDVTGEKLLSSGEDAGAYLQLSAPTGIPVAGPVPGKDFTISVDTVAPNPPAGLIGAPGIAQVFLSWAAPTSNADNSQLRDLLGFVVQRSTPGGSFATLTPSPISSGTLTFTDSQAVPGVANSYRVRSADFGLNLSSPTAPVLVTPSAGGTILGAISSFTATTSGVFRVRLATSPTANAPFLAESNLASYSFTGLSSGTYFLRGFRDLDNDNQQNLASEPAGTFGGLRTPYPIYIFGGNSVPGADVTICDRTKILVSSPLAGAFSPSDCPAKDKGPGNVTDLYAFAVGDGSPGSVGLGAQVDIFLNSNFDNELIVLGPDGQVLARDNRPGGAFVRINANAPGVYLIEPTSFNPGIFGPYTISLNVTGGFFGSISGNVGYSGAKTGTIRIQLFSSPEAGAFPIQISTRSSPGSYAFAGLPDGIYYVRAFRDFFANLVKDPGEPTGVFGILESSPTAISMAGGISSLSGGADITLTDPAAGAVKGTIVYDGNQSGKIRVEAGFKECEDCESIDIVQFASTGTGNSYFLDFLAPATNYIVRAYVDGNGNFNPDTLEAKVSSSPVNVVANSTTTVNLVVLDPGSGPPGNGSIQGVISYGGSQGGTIYVGFARDPHLGFIDYVLTLSDTGNFLKSGVLDNTTYYVASFRDVNNNGNVDEKLGEPVGVGVPEGFNGEPSFPPPPIFVPLSGSATANITLQDPPSGSISGQASYGGSAPLSQKLVVQAFVQQDGGEHTFQSQTITRVAGQSQYGYSLPFLAAATNYNVSAFIDANANNHSDFGEPFGQFGGAVCSGTGSCFGAPVAVSTGPGSFPTYGINFQVNDAGSFGGNLSAGRIQGSISYLGTQSGPVVIRFFQTPDFSGSPLFTVNVPLPPGPGEVDFDKSGLPFGTYFIDAFRDPSGTGVFNPTFDAHGVINNAQGVSVSQTRPQVFAGHGSVVDPGQGGSLNVFTGSFTALSGARFDGGATDIAATVALDLGTPGGPFPYVLGLTGQISGVNTLLVKYSSSGVRLSSAAIAFSEDEVSPIAVDSQGRVFKGGSIEFEDQFGQHSTGTLTRFSSGLAPIQTLKIDPTSDIKALAFANTFLYTVAPSNSDSALTYVLKFNPGTLVAVATGTFSLPPLCFNDCSGIENRFAIGSDPAGGDVYVFALLDGAQGGFGRRAALVKFGGLNLNYVSQADAGGLNLGTEVRLSVDASGDVYLAGASPDQTSISTYKFSSNLVQIASATYSPVVVHFGGGINNMDLDPDGNVYQAWETPANGGDFVILRYDPSLKLVNSRTFDGFNNTLEDFAFGIAVQDSSNVFVTGGVNNSRNLDWATMRLNMNQTGAISASGQSVVVTTTTASNAIYGSLSYDGTLVTSGTVRSVLLPFDSEVPVRLSSAPFARKTSYLFNNLVAGTYRIQAFIDPNNNFQPEAGEPIIFSTATGIFFSGPNIPDLNLVLCDRRPILPAVDVNDTLANTDCPAPDRGGARQRLYTFAGTRGQPITIGMVAKTFYDSYLTLYGPNGKLLTTDDESAGSGNARIVFTLPVDGLYTVGASAFAPNVTGSFRLSLGGSAGSLGSISGDVTYTGVQGGQIVVGLFDSPSFSSASFVAGIALTSTRTFQFAGLLAGTSYFMGAFVDVNFNNNPDFGEDKGVFGNGGVPAPLFLQNGQNVAGVTIVVSASTTAVANTGYVTGAISYPGTRLGSLRVELWSSADFAGRPVAARTVPVDFAPGTYTYDIVVPGGVNYFLRAFLDSNGDFLPNPDEPKGVYSPNGQGAQPLFVPAGGNVSNADFSIADPGFSAGGISGEGTASLSPATAPAGSQVFSATITFVTGASGIQAGGAIGFIVPPGFSFPFFVTATSTSAATLSAVNFSGLSALVNVTGGSLLPGQEVKFLYDNAFVPCASATGTFTVASAQNGSVPAQPLFAGSPSLRIVPGPASLFQTANPYFSLTQGVLSDPQSLEARDNCGNKTPVAGLKTAALRAKRFDLSAGQFLDDPTVGLSSAATVSTASAISLDFAAGQSSRTFFAVSISTGFKNIELFSDILYQATYYYGLTVLPANALTNASVSTAAFQLGRSSASITPNNDGDADLAFVNFTMGDPNQSWHVLVSSIPFKPGVPPFALWERWGFGQPSLGAIAWDGRSSPWINGGLRVPNGLYYVRVEVGGFGGVHDDSLQVNVNVAQLSGRFFDAGLIPNPPLSGARIQIFGPNGTSFTQTDANGSYALPGIAAGTYNMFVSRDDFLNGTLSVAVTAAGAVSTFTALSNAVSASLNASGGLDVLMNRSPALLVVPSIGVGYSTKSFDQWGSLQVRSLSDSSVRFGPMRLPAGSFVFDDGGQWDPSVSSFVFRTQLKFNVAAGTYTVEAFFAGFAPSSATLFVGQTGATANLPAFAKKSSVSGLVTVPANPNGLFISVNAVPLSSSTLVTGGFGGVSLAPGVLSDSYTVFNLDPGSYILRANTFGLPAVSSGPVNVPAATDVTGVNLTFTGTGGEISGNVTVLGNTSSFPDVDAGVHMRVFINAWSPGSFNFGFAQVVVPAGTDVAVPYSVKGLDTGTTYQVYVNLEKRGDVEYDLVGVQPFLKVAAIAPTPLNFAFAPSSGAILGSITLPPGNTDFINVNLFGQTIASARPENVGHQFQILGAQNLPGFLCQPANAPAPSGYCPAGNSSATFTVQGLNTETDDVTLFYTTTGETKRVRLSVVNGSTTTISVNLAAQTFSISGAVNNQITNALFNTNPKLVQNAPDLPILDSAGQPVPIDPAGVPKSTASLARVLAIRQEITAFNTAISTSFDPTSTRAGFLTESGTYTITNVPAGVYFLRTANLRACATCEILVPAVGKIVRVSNANVPGVDLILSDGFSAGGTISLEDGILDSRIFEVTALNSRQEVVRSTSVLLGNLALGLRANSVDYSFSNLPANEFYTLVVRGTLFPIKYAGRPIKFPDPALSPRGLQSSLTSQNVLMRRAAYVVGRLKDANTGELIRANNVTLLAPSFRISATANPWIEGGFVVAASSVEGRPMEFDDQGDLVFRVGPLIPEVSYDLRLAQTSWDPLFLARGSQNYAPVTLSGLTPQPGEIKDVGVVSLNQGQALTGTVRQSTTTGALLGNIKVAAKPSFGFVDLRVETFTNQQGQYTLWVSSAVSSQYDVTAAPRDGNLANNGLVYGEATLRNVNLLGTTTADFLLEPLLAKVTGQVAVEDAAAGGELSFPFGDKKGFPAAAINLQPIGVVPIKNPLGDIEGITDERGNFEMLGLSTGTFSLRATSLGYSVLKATVSSGAAGFIIYTGSNTPPNYIPDNILVLRRGATVTGRIVKSDGSAPNDTEVGGVAAANFGQGEFVIGAVDVDPVARTVNSYSISGFKPGVSYDIVILPKNAGDLIIFPPEGNNVSFTVDEATATKTINLTFVTAGFDCVLASKKALGNNQFQLRIECTGALRKKIASDDDLDQVLSTSAVTSQGVVLAPPHGDFLQATKALSGSRRRITAVYQAVPNETNFSLRIRAVSADVDPKTGQNFSVDKVFDLFVGLDSIATEKVSNIQGGSVELEPTADDEAAGKSERAKVDLGPGTFAGSDDVVVASKTIDVTISKGTDEDLAKTLALKKLGYVPASLDILSQSAAFPPEMASAMKAYKIGASGNGGVNPLSSFYSIFLPAGIRHQLKEHADLTLSYTLAASSATNPDDINVWFYNATLGRYVLEAVNRRLDLVNNTVTVTVDHLSTFVVLASSPVVQIKNLIEPAQILAVNFPNPSDCVVHSNVAANSQLFGGGATHAPFKGTMLRYSLPPGDAAGMRIRIYNVAGELVRTIDQGALAGGFTYYTPWDCGNDSGRTVSSGVYIGEIDWGSRRAFFKIAIIKGSGL